MIAREHKIRIQNELREAGATLYGLAKNESRHLPNIIRPDEHIEAIAYGRYTKGSCMLVATNSRVIFLDKKPLFTFFDEMMYEIVSGVACSIQGYFAAVTLHTRFNDIDIRYVNINAAKRFVDFIEKRRINTPDTQEDIQLDAPVTSQNGAVAYLSRAEMSFMASHKLGILSTTDKNGRVHGSVVKYYVENNQAIYILARPESTKAKNIFAHRHVALTVYNDNSFETLQIHGRADVDTDPTNKLRVVAALTPDHHKSRNYSYHLIRISPLHVKFANHRAAHSADAPSPLLQPPLRLYPSQK